MKELWESRTVWAGGVLTALGAFLLYLQAAPAGTFPDWVPYTAGGLVPLLGAVVVALRVQDKRATTSTIAPLPTAGDIVERKARPRCNIAIRGGGQCEKEHGHGGGHAAPNWRSNEPA